MGTQTKRVGCSTPSPLPTANVGKAQSPESLKDSPNGCRPRVGLPYDNAKRERMRVALLWLLGPSRTYVGAFGEPDTLKGVRPVRRGVVGNVLEGVTRWPPTLS